MTKLAFVEGEHFLYRADVGDLPTKAFCLSGVGSDGTPYTRRGITIDQLAELCASSSSDSRVIQEALRHGFLRTIEDYIDLETGELFSHVEASDMKRFRSRYITRLKQFWQQPSSITP